jgi:hypothetical protein
MLFHVGRRPWGGKLCLSGQVLVNPCPQRRHSGFKARSFAIYHNTRQLDPLII